MVGILLSYWGGLFSGAMLVSGSAHTYFAIPVFVLFIVPNFFLCYDFLEDEMSWVHPPPCNSGYTIYSILRRGQCKPSLSTVTGWGFYPKSLNKKKDLNPRHLPGPPRRPPPSGSVKVVFWAEVEWRKFSVPSNW